MIESDRTRRRGRSDRQRMNNKSGNCKSRNTSTGAGTDQTRERGGRVRRVNGEREEKRSDERDK